jgi:predicted GIY-YIG superfamily endonuclease
VSAASNALSLSKGGFGPFEVSAASNALSLSKGGFVNWTVYILRCGNGTYYVGHTHDLHQRLCRHVNKLGARHTAQNSVLDLLYQETHAAEIDAIRRELQIKKWSRAKKEALIRGNLQELRRLSRSRD